MCNKPVLITAKNQMTDVSRWNVPCHVAGLLVWFLRAGNTCLTPVPGERLKYLFRRSELRSEHFISYMHESLSRNRTNLRASRRFFSGCKGKHFKIRQWNQWVLHWIEEPRSYDAILAVNTVPTNLQDDQTKCVCMCLSWRVYEWKWIEKSEKRAPIFDICMIYLCCIYECKIELLGVSCRVNREEEVVLLRVSFSFLQNKSFG